MQPAEQFLSANTHTVLGFLPVALLGLISFQQLSDRTGALLRSGSYASFILIFFACTVLRDVLKVAGVAELHPFSALPYLVLLVASTRDAKPVRFLPAAAILAVFVALDVFHLQAHDTSVQPATIFDSMRAVYWPQAWTTAHVSSALARVCGVAFATISMERALSAMREHNPHRTRYAAAAVAAVLLLPQYVHLYVVPSLHFLGAQPKAVTDASVWVASYLLAFSAQ